MVTVAFLRSLAIPDVAASIKFEADFRLLWQPSALVTGAPGRETGTLLKMTRTSAGILLYRRRVGVLEVLLVHPGGPFFGNKDLGNWSVPKGEVDPTDPDYEQTARREFLEEVGHPVPDGPLIDLGSIRQKSGKIVYAWAVEGDIDTATMSSNFIEFDWPPFSGRKKRFPEVDKWVYFDPAEARRHIKETQAPLLERLDAVLSTSQPPGRPPR